jgi:preprotein translocase SecE subunit
MAKTRAQRKAERRARLAEEQQRQGQERGEESRAQHDTQVPVSGDVAEIEAIERTGANLEELESPAPSRADAPPASRADTKPAPEEQERKPSRAQRREEKRRQKAQQEQQARKARDREKAAASGQERRHGAVVGFIASCWAELKRVQWPDRPTLVQATAVTVVFIAVAAVYLGVLDLVFNRVIKVVL